MAYRRSIFLIDRKFQLRFSFYVCAWLMALCFIYPVLIFNVFDFFIRFLASHPSSALSPSVIEQLKSTRQEVVWLLILLQASYLVLSFLLSLFISHRIAGPVYKLRQTFEAVKAGRFNEELRFRTKDHFTELAVDFNALLQSMKADASSNIDKLTSSIAQLEKLAAEAPEASRKALNDALGSLREVREKIPH